MNKQLEKHMKAERLRKRAELLKVEQEIRSSYNAGYRSGLNTPSVVINSTAFMEDLLTQFKHELARQLAEEAKDQIPGSVVYDVATKLFERLKAFPLTGEETKLFREYLLEKHAIRFSMTLPSLHISHEIDRLRMERYGDRT